MQDTQARGWLRTCPRCPIGKQSLEFDAKLLGEAGSVQQARSKQRGTLTGPNVCQSLDIRGQRGGLGDEVGGV